MKKQRSASPSHAIPRSAPSSTTLSHDELAVLGQQRVRLVVGEVAVRRPVMRHEVEPEALQQRTDHRPGHPVAAVDDDLQRLDRARVHERERDLVEGVVEVDLLDRARARGRRVRDPALDQPADVLDALVARQRERALAHELRAGVRLRVVRGGAHQAAVELARADEPVEHLGADHSRRRAPRRPRARAHRGSGRPARGGQAHVAPDADAQLADRLAGERGEDVRERAADQLGDVAVDVLARDAADVVRLEDAGGDLGHESADPT